MEVLSAPAIAGPLTIQATINVSRSIFKAFLDAQLSREQEQTIKDAATSMCVFGGNSHLRREPKDYAESPIMAHIKKNCSKPGIIYVAYVPNNKGKTTACYACMDKPYARRGVAFSPEYTPRVPYFDSMVASLGFDPENPPKGFMIRLLVELAKGEDHPELKSNLIILDNFMSHGFNPEDSCFLHNLKGHIKESGVTALVLTSNRDAACHLLSQNELGTIVPLATNRQIVELRRANPRIDPDTPLVFDWEQHVSMVWDKDELKKALVHSSAFLKLDEAKRNTIIQCFDSVYNGLSREDKDAADPISIMEQFNESQRGITTPRAGTFPTGGIDGTQGVCFGAGTHCTIL